MFTFPKRDLIFLPGTGGHFIFKMISDVAGLNVIEHEVTNNEFHYDQASSNYALNDKSKRKIFDALIDKENHYEFGKMIDYLNKMVDISNYKCYNSIDNKNLITNALGKFLDPTTSDQMVNTGEHLINNIQLGEYLIRKQKSFIFSIEDEAKQLPEEYGFFYSKLHEHFYSNYENNYGFTWDIGHIPYHVNCFYDTKTKDIGDYKYAAIFTGDSFVYTDSLRRLKHAMRNNASDYDFDSAVGKNVNIIVNNVSQNIELEAKTFDISSRFAEIFNYKSLIVKNRDSQWIRLFTMYGLLEEYLNNKNEIHDRIREYHASNMKLMLTHFTAREIENMQSSFG